MSNKLILDVLDQLIDDMSLYMMNKGFKLKRKKTFTRRSQECIQELNVLFRHIKGQEAGYVEVYQNIIFDEVEKTAAYLNGEDYKKDWPTAAANIGNLQSNRQFIDCPLTLTTDVSKLAEIIIKSIKKNAIPFWEDFSTLDQLRVRYENSDPRLTLNGNSYIWRLISVYCIQKEYDKALKKLEEWKVARPSGSIIEKAREKINNLMSINN